MPYDELDNVSRVKSVLDNVKVIHNSRRPLRWIANWAGSIASGGVLDLFDMEEEGYAGWRYKVKLFFWKTFWPIYDRWGTTYLWDVDDAAWDDYDENGVPYWEKWDLWDYEDEETGDAFRVIKK